MFFRDHQSSSKNKLFQSTQQDFEKKILEKRNLAKFWVDKGTEYRGIYKQLCKEKDIENYSTVIETKAICRAHHSIIRRIIYRYWLKNFSQLSSVCVYNENSRL